MMLSGGDEMPWYKVTLSDNDIRAHRMTELQDAFSDLHLEAGDPDDAAIFHTNDAGPGSVLYFSPAASRIAMQLVVQFTGVETAAPTRDGLGLFVGRPLAWETVAFALEPPGRDSA